MAICIVGDNRDLSAAYVGWLAAQRGLEVHMLPEHELGLSWWFDLEGRESTLMIGGRPVPLATITGAFVRFNPRPPVPETLGVPPDAEAVFAIERRNGIEWLLEAAPFPVVNRPTAGRSNGSKPLQMRLLSEHGFDVPAWVATNDPVVADRILKKYPSGVVYKACSGLRSHVRRADETLVHRLGQGTAPVVLQRYVVGTDVRVHVVGQATFATEIRSEAIDYRWSAHTPTYERCEVPSAIRGRCLHVAQAEGLHLAGIDFRLGRHGRWWCLEVNPVPTFLPYEAATAHPIGDAALDILVPEPSVVQRSPLAGDPAASPREGSFDEHIATGST